MKELSKTLRRSVYLQLTPFILLIGVVILVMVQTFLNAKVMVSDLVSILVVLGLMGAAVYWFYRAKMSLPSYWEDKVENAPEDVLWISPVVTTTKFKMVVKVGESLSYELHTKDDKLLVVHTSHMNSGELILSFMETFPDAHYGYTEEVKKLYKTDPKEFITNLKNSNLYNAMISYSI